MTSGSVRDRHEFHCDSCEDAVKIIFADDLKEATAVLKRDGWGVFKHEEHWHHECPKCSD